jgi:hypothetical protein
LNPPKHVDIASSLYFCSLISALVPVAFYDYRPAKLGLSSLESGFADLSSLPFPARRLIVAFQNFASPTSRLCLISLALS